MLAWFQSWYEEAAATRQPRFSSAIAIFKDE
jgi:hypothetical protein